VFVFSLLLTATNWRTLKLDDAGSGSVVEWSSSVLEVMPEVSNRKLHWWSFNIGDRTTCDFSSWQLRRSLVVEVVVSDNNS
jgi:hypothetical protein